MQPSYLDTKAGTAPAGPVYGAPQQGGMAPVAYNPAGMAPVPVGYNPAGGAPAPGYNPAPPVMMVGDTQYVAVPPGGQAGMAPQVVGVPGQHMGMGGGMGGGGVMGGGGALGGAKIGNTKATKPSPKSTRMCFMGTIFASSLILFPVAVVLFIIGIVIACTDKKEKNGLTKNIIGLVLTIVGTILFVGVMVGSMWPVFAL